MALEGVRDATLKGRPIENGGGTRTIKLLAYCLGTFAEKYIEIGIIFLSLHIFHSLKSALIAGLVFQVVKFVTALTRIRFAPVAALFATAVGTVLLYVGSQKFLVFLAGMLLCSFPLLYIRIWAKQGLGPVEKPKNIVRAGGLILAPFFSPLAAAALAVVAICLLAVVPGKTLFTPVKMQFKPVGFVQANHLAMFAHHAHYFAYSYAVPYLIVYLHGIPTAWQGVMFYLGWLGYDIYDFVNLKPSWRRFLAGHVLAGVSIVGLFYAVSPVTAGIFWFLTGVGGGTVAMLSQLRSQDDPAPNGNLDVAEHYGHVVGVILLLVLAETIRLELVGLVAGILSVLTPIVAMWWVKRAELRTVNRVAN